MCKMKLPVTAFPRWGMYMAIPIHTKLWTPSLATCYQKNPQIFIFIVSQTSEVLFIKPNFRYLLWLVAKQFLSKGWIVSENIHFLQTPFKSATTVFSWLSHAEQVETILNAHFQKICCKKMIKIFHVASKQCITRACSEWTCYPQFLEGFKIQIPFCTLTNL